MSENLSFTKPDISYRAIAHLAAPILVANISIIGSGTIDTIMAGRLGAEHLAAVAIGNATVIMVILTLVGVIQSLSPLAGHHFGARRFERIGFELTQSLWLSLLLGLVGLAILSATDFWIGLCDAQGNVARMLRIYLLASAASVPAFMLARPFVALNAAVNLPRVTMWVSIGLLVLKAPLNYVFMYGLFGLPALGGAGAGVSSALGATVSLIALYSYWRFSHVYDAMRPARIYLPNWQAIKTHLKIGVPISLSMFFEISSFALMAILIGRIGTIDVAAHQIVSNTTSFIYQAPLSLGIAVSVLVAQCLGAGSPTLARQAMMRVMRFALGIAAVTCSCLFLFRHTVVSFFTTDPAVMLLAESLLGIAVIFHIADALQTISSFALRGYRVTFLPMCIYGVLLWSVGLGGGCWLGFHAESFGGPFGAHGFWAATATGIILVSIAISTYAFYIAKDRLKDERVARAYV